MCVSNRLLKSILSFTTDFVCKFLSLNLPVDGWLVQWAEMLVMCSFRLVFSDEALLQLMSGSLLQMTFSNTNVMMIHKHKDDLKLKS